MTYANLRNLVKALLTGDNVLPNDNDQVLMMLAYAFDKVSKEADALKLFTTDVESEQILRNGPGGIFLRKPELPIEDDEELDVDDDLCFPLARYMASFISREKGAIHVNEAQTLIRAYNQKIEAFLENVDKDGKLEEYDDQDMYGKREV